MLEIKFPPKLEGFIQGFELASLNLPDKYNPATILFPEDEETNTTAPDTPVNQTVETNERFAFYGFTSPVFLVQQSSFVVAFLACCLLFGLLKLIAMSPGGERKIKIEKKLVWLVLAGLQRVMVSYSSPVCTSLVLSFVYVRLDSSFNVLSFVSSIVLVVALFALTAYIAWFLTKNMERLSDDDFEPRYGAFYHRLKRNNRYAVIFNAVVVFRRMTVTLLLAAPLKVHLQVFLMNVSNFLFLVYIMGHKPYDEPKENNGLIITEGSFAVATMLLPFIIVDSYTDVVEGMMLNVLRGSAILGGAVSILFLLRKLFVKLYGKCCKRRVRERNQDSVDKDYDFAAGTEEHFPREEVKKRNEEEIKEKMF